MATWRFTRLLSGHSAEHRPDEALAMLDRISGVPGGPCRQSDSRRSRRRQLRTRPVRTGSSRHRQKNSPSWNNRAGRTRTSFPIPSSGRLEQLQNLSIVQGVCAHASGPFGGSLERRRTGPRGRRREQRPCHERVAGRWWEARRAWLGTGRAAFVSFSLGQQGALVFSAGPGDDPALRLRCFRHSVTQMRPAGCWTAPRKAIARSGPESSSAPSRTFRRNCSACRRAGKPCGAGRGALHPARCVSFSGALRSRRFEQRALSERSLSARHGAFRNVVLASAAGAREPARSASRSASGRPQKASR